MANKRYVPKISSSSIEDFQKTLEQLMNLPEHICDQIESAESSSHFGVVCLFDKEFNKKQLTLPFGTRQIKDFGDYIAFYNDFNFLFKLYKIDGKTPSIDFVIAQFQTAE